MGVINILIFIGVAIFAVILYIRRQFSHWADRGVPFVEPTIPYGNVQGIRSTRNLFQITQQLYNTMKSTGAQFMGMYFYTKPTVLALDLDFIKNVLVKDFNYFHDRGVYYNEKDDPLSAHLFSIAGQKWRNLRMKLTPTFTSGKMKMMFPTIIKIGEEFKNTMQVYTKKNPEIEIRDILARFTTDVIGTCAFGLDCNSLKDPNAEFRKNGKKLFESFSAFRQSFTMVFQKLSLKLGITIIPQDIANFFMNAVKETVAYREEHQVKRNDFMDLLIDLKNSKDEDNRLTVEEIAAQAFVFFLAGFETSSTVMSFALYELALNQKLQNKARESVREALKKNNGELTYESMMDMTYIMQCLNESMRKYPPVADLIRSVTKEYHVPNSKVVLPKGQTVIIPIYAIQHDPTYFVNPEVYDPERFTPENEANRNPYTFLPFGEGPRNCIGLRFGLMQARIGLATLLNNFRFELSDKTSVPLKISASAPILTPVGGIWLKVEQI